MLFFTMALADNYHKSGNFQFLYIVAGAEIERKKLFINTIGVRGCLSETLSHIKTKCLPFWY